MRLLLFFLIFCAAALAATPRPVAAQNLADRDWRTLATPATIERIEQWEDWFVRTQSRIAAMNGVGSDGRPTEPFEVVSVGEPVFDIPARWAGERSCRRVQANLSIVLAYDWFRCRIFKSDGQWRVEKTTGSVRFEVWLFRDEKFGTVALGDAWVDIGKRSSRLGGDSTLSKLAYVLRYDGAKMLRMFDPYLDGYRVLEIDLGR